MKKNIIYFLLASLLLLPGCADYLDQDPEQLNSMDKIFSSDIETRKWYNRIYSDDFMVTEMHYSGQIPYFWCTDESAYTMESYVRNISEGKMSPDNYYGFTRATTSTSSCATIRPSAIATSSSENVDQCLKLGEVGVARCKPRRVSCGPSTISSCCVSTARYPLSTTAVRLRNQHEPGSQYGLRSVAWINNEIDEACENGMPTERNESLELGLPTVGAARAIQSRMALMVASPLFNGNTVYKSWTNKDGTVLMPQTYDKELWKKAADAARWSSTCRSTGCYRAPERCFVRRDRRQLPRDHPTWGADKNKEMIWGAIPTPAVVCDVRASGTVVWLERPLFAGHRHGQRFLHG